MRDRDAGVRGEGIASSLGAMDRGRGGAGWMYSSTLKLSDLLPLTRGAYLHKYLGLVDGYPIYGFNLGLVERQPKEVW